MVGHNSPTFRQAKPQTPSKWVEQVVLGLGRDAGACVGDFNLYGLPYFRRSDLPQRNSDCAVLPNRLDRVVDDRLHRNMQLLPVARKLNRRGSLDR